MDHSIQRSPPFSFKDTGCGIGQVGYRRISSGWGHNPAFSLLESESYLCLDRMTRISRYWYNRVELCFVMWYDGLTCADLPWFTSPSHITGPLSSSSCHSTRDIFVPASSIFNRSRWSLGRRLFAQPPGGRASYQPYPRWSFVTSIGLTTS